MVFSQLYQTNTRRSITYAELTEVDAIALEALYACNKILSAEPEDVQSSEAEGLSGDEKSVVSEDEEGLDGGSKNNPIVLAEETNTDNGKETGSGKRNRSTAEVERS